MSTLPTLCAPATSTANTPIQKVGKQNFKPPPKVESDVVRIEPLTGSARPNIAFEEFDGLLRIAFNRKNKTLRAGFSQKEVLAMCERVSEPSNPPPFNKPL